MKIFTIDMIPAGTKKWNSLPAISIALKSGRITLSPEAVKQLKLSFTQRFTLGADGEKLYLVIDHPKGLPCRIQKNGSLVVQNRAFTELLLPELNMPTGNDSVKYEINNTMAFLNDKCPAYEIKKGTILKKSGPDGGN